MDEYTIDDFKVGERVMHVFHCRWATVEKVGTKYLHVKIHIAPERQVRWLPTSVIKERDSG